MCGWQGTYEFADGAGENFYAWRKVVPYKEAPPQDIIIFAGEREGPDEVRPHINCRQSEEYREGEAFWCVSIPGIMCIGVVSKPIPSRNFDSKIFLKRVSGHTIKTLTLTMLASRGLIKDGQ